MVETGNNTDTFLSPSYGLVTFVQLRQRVLQFMKQFPASSYRLVIGSDSQVKNGAGADFVTAIVVHRIGSGGIYFWRREVGTKHLPLRNRIYQEALLSLHTARALLKVFEKDGISKYDVEIHVDIGTVGDTRDMISEIVGMIRGSGFQVKTKPDSYGASKVADRHT